jgi:peptidoglycan/xylan/chitin deacetylase (PgdA/CDA1 family)
LRQLDHFTRAATRFALVELVGRLLYYAGVLFMIGWLRQRVGSRRLIIPMYHRVQPSVDSNAELLDVQRGVSPELLERHVRVFRWFGPLVTLDEGFDHLRSSSQPRRTAIAITFDDGYRDNVQLAVPLLTRFGARATIFPVVRTAAGGRPLWWDELADVLARGTINGAGLVPYLAGLDNCLLSPRDRARVGPNAQRSDMAEVLSRRLIELPGPRREQVIGELAKRLSVPDAIGAEQRYAGWDELRAAADAGFEIGGHTVDHVVLPCEAPATAASQITDCRGVLERELGRPIRSFAYPNGRNDATVRALVAAAGFRLAVTVEHGVNNSDTDPHQLRRMPIGRERPFELALKLAFYGWVNRR